MTTLWPIVTDALHFVLWLVGVEHFTPDEPPHGA
jgi:hypothetical protein